MSERMAESVRRPDATLRPDSPDVSPSETRPAVAMDPSPDTVPSERDAPSSAATVVPCGMSSGAVTTCEPFEAVMFPTTVKPDPASVHEAAALSNVIESTERLSFVTVTVFGRPYRVKREIPALLPILLELLQAERLNRFLSYMGSISLELYLSHVALKNIVRMSCPDMQSWRTSKCLIVYGVVVILGATLFSSLFHLIQTRIEGAIASKRKEKSPQ